MTTTTTTTKNKKKKNNKNIDHENTYPLPAYNERGAHGPDRAEPPEAADRKEVVAVVPASPACIRRRHPGTSWLGEICRDGGERKKRKQPKSSFSIYRSPRNQLARVDLWRPQRKKKEKAS